MFTLALSLHRTVEELRQTMGAYEFHQWCAYYAISGEKGSPHHTAASQTPAEMKTILGRAMRAAGVQPPTNTSD